MRSSHRRVSEVQTMLLVLVEGSPIEGEPWFSVMFIVLRKDEDRTVERGGEGRGTEGREERQGPSASATNNHNSHPRQRSSAVGIDLTMEKERDQRGNGQRVLAT
jgi:hypothetical protein